MRASVCAARLFMLAAILGGCEQGDPSSPVKNVGGADVGRPEPDPDHPGPPVGLDVEPPPRPDCNVAPGPGVIRRLTRREFANTVRDLLGDAGDVVRSLPPDAEYRGFDSIAEVQAASPLLIEGYWEASRVAADAVTRDPGRLAELMACGAPDQPPAAQQTIQGEAMDVSGGQLEGDVIAFYTNGQARGAIDAGETGDYVFRLRGGGDPAYGEGARVILRVDGSEVFEYTLDAGSLALYENDPVRLTAGAHTIELAFVNDVYDADSGADRNFYLDWLQVEGPLAAEDEDPEAFLRDCVDGFLPRFAATAWRRPLDDEELQQLRAVYDAGAGADGVAGGVNLFLRAVLQSPNLLYLVETGTPVEGQPGLFLLTDHEIAARLSYLAWETLPDDALRAAADAGELRTVAQVQAQAERLFGDPRARDAVREFYSQWLRLNKVPGLERDAEAYPDFDPAIRDSMLEETTRFLDRIIWDEGGGYTDLLTSRRTFVDGRLAALYGLEAAGDDFREAEVPEGERAGLLTQASILALTAKPYESSPVHRGKFVREQILCDEMPQPPPGAMITPPARDPSATTRERWSQHSRDPACSGCHKLMDPIGFTFEAYDAVGRLRLEENGHAVDTIGEVVGTPGAEGSIADAVELSDRLVRTWKAPECAARQWFRYGMGRIEVAGDACSVRHIADALTTEDGDLRSMFVALAATPAFLHRVEAEPAEGEQ